MFVTIVEGFNNIISTHLTSFMTLIVIIMLGIMKILNLMSRVEAGILRNKFKVGAMRDLNIMRGVRVFDYFLC